MKKSNDARCQPSPAGRRLAAVDDGVTAALANLDVAERAGDVSNAEARCLRGRLAGVRTQLTRVRVKRADLYRPVEVGG